MCHVVTSNFVCVSHAECYSEASDHEEAESTEIPPPPYSEQTLRDSMDAAGPPGSTHQVSHVLQSALRLYTGGCQSLSTVVISSESVVFN